MHQSEDSWFGLDYRFDLRMHSQIPTVKRNMGKLKPAEWKMGNEERRAALKKN
jgi:hypothetical protein